MVKDSQYNGNAKSSEKTGDVTKYDNGMLITAIANILRRDDVNELLELISVVRGFPSHPSKDVYGLDTKIDFNTVRLIGPSGYQHVPNQHHSSKFNGRMKTRIRRRTRSPSFLQRPRMTLREWQLPSNH